MRSIITYNTSSDIIWVTVIMRIRETGRLIRNDEWKRSLWKNTRISKGNFKMDLKERNGRMQLGLTLILRRSRTGMVWFYTSTSNKRAARPKLYTKSLTRDLKLMYSRLTLVRISINLQAPSFFYIGTGVSLLSRERFLYI